MSVPRKPGSTPSTSKADQNFPNTDLPNYRIQRTNNNPLSQLDGANDHQVHVSGGPMRSNYGQLTVPHTQQQPARSQLHAARMIPQQTAPLKAARIPGNAVSDLLPYCTTGPPLVQEQAIALTDAAGSLKELVLLALGAISGDAGCVERLEGAVGYQTTMNIAEFFGNEWEIDG